MPKTTLRIILATAIVFHSALSFVPSSTRNQNHSTLRHVISHPHHHHVRETSSLISSSLPPPLLCMQRRRKSGLCVSQQQNEYAESSSATTRTTSSSDLNTVITAEFKESDHYYETAIRRTVGWVAAAIGFGTALGFFAGSQTSEEFFAGYLLEQSLSIDNLLVFLLLFEYFRIPLENQNRILNWGIIGAIVMRAIMIGAGAIAIQKFHAVLLVFAGILIFSSGKVIFGGNDDDDDSFDLSENQIVKFSNSVINSTDKFDGDRFFTEIDGIRKATPMLLCMVAVEVSDVVFAVDSIPAVFGVTENPLVVFTSNMFAIMGLRSLYTILSKAASELKYLDKAVAVVLGFIGCKMIAEYVGYELPTELSVGVVITLLGTGVLASVLDKNEEEESSESS